MTARKKISTTVYITAEQDEQLKQLHARTKVPVAEYIRMGIDLILKEHERQLPGQLDLLEGRGREPLMVEPPTLLSRMDLLRQNAERNKKP